MVKKNIPASGSKLMEKPGTSPTTTNDTYSDSLSDTEDFLYRNKNILIGAAILVLLVAGGWFGYNYYQRSQNLEAQKYMFPAVYHFEKDSLTKALKGDGINDGLLTIADEYGSTKAGELAGFYAGVAYLKEGKFDDAINYLKDVSTSDLLVQARAYSLIGDAYMEKGSFQEAINYYEKAANYNSNKFFTPQYLYKLALAQEAANNNPAAISTYDKILEEYPTSQEATAAKKYKSKLEGLVSK